MMIAGKDLKCVRDYYCIFVSCTEGKFRGRPGMRLLEVIFEPLNFRGLLKLKHFVDFMFEDRGSFDHNPTVNNDFEALNFPRF